MIASVSSPAPISRLRRSTIGAGGREHCQLERLLKVVHGFSSPWSAARSTGCSRRGRSVGPTWSPRAFSSQSFNRDGSLLASGGGDYQVKIWRTAAMAANYGTQAPYQPREKIEPVILSGHNDSVF